jgi:hypothetical protein
MGGNYELLAVMVGTLNFTPKLTDFKSDMDVESHPLSHHVHADTVTDECLRFSADYSRSGVDLILSKDGLYDPNGSSNSSMPGSAAGSNQTCRRGDRGNTKIGAPFAWAYNR